MQNLCLWYLKNVTSVNVSLRGNKARRKTILVCCFVWSYITIGGILCVLFLLLSSSFNQTLTQQLCPALSQFDNNMLLTFFLLLFCLHAIWWPITNRLKMASNVINRSSQCWYGFLLPIWASLSLEEKSKYWYVPRGWSVLQSGFFYVFPCYFFSGKQI